MNTYLRDGRNKKLQTRQKLPKTARQLLSHSQEFTLDEFAKQNNLARETFYWYNSNVELVAAEAVLGIQDSIPDLISRGSKGSCLLDRLRKYSFFYNTLTLDDEASLRNQPGIVVNDIVLEGIKGHR